MHIHFQTIIFINNNISLTGNNFSLIPNKSLSLLDIISTRLDTTEVG